MKLTKPLVNAKIKFTLALSSLNTAFTSKTQLYIYLSRTCFLPEMNSRACTLRYMSQVLLTPHKVYVQYRQTPAFATHKFPRKSYSLQTVHNYLVGLLKRKNEKPLGFDDNTMKADWNWYATVILILEPEDRLALKHRILPYSIDRFPIMMDQR